MSRRGETGSVFTTSCKRVGERFAHERRPAREQVIENRAERIDVAAPADQAALGRGLLRRHVVGRAEHLAAQGQFAVVMQPLGQAEVGHARLVERVDQHVGRLEVAVQNAAFVRVVDGLGDGLDVTRGAAAGQRLRPLPQSSARFWPSTKSIAKNCCPSCTPTSWMATMFGCCKLAAAAASARNRCASSVARLVAEQEHLHRDDAAKAHLPRLVDDAHAAAGDFFEQFVVAEGTQAEVYDACGSRVGR